MIYFVYICIFIYIHIHLYIYIYIFTYLLVHLIIYYTFLSLATRRVARSGNVNLDAHRFRRSPCLYNLLNLLNNFQIATTIRRTCMNLHRYFLDENTTTSKENEKRNGNALRVLNFFQNISWNTWTFREFIKLKKVSNNLIVRPMENFLGSILVE